MRVAILNIGWKLAPVVRNLIDMIARSYNRLVASGLIRHSEYQRRNKARAGLSEKFTASYNHNYSSSRLVLVRASAILPMARDCHLACCFIRGSDLSSLFKRGASPLPNCPSQHPKRGCVHSDRRACMGSTDAARRAGATTANRATTSNAAAPTS